MSEARQIQVMLEQAGVQRRLGNHRTAIELCQRALAMDPNHAGAHADLALSLLKARRLQAAGIEVRTALALDGNDHHIHYVAAAVLRAERKLDDAWAHVLVALDSDAADPWVRVLGAEIQRLKGDTAKAKELLLEALADDAHHVGALTELAELELYTGDRTSAAEHIAEALKQDSGNLEAHVMAGFVALAQGNASSAEEHARFVLGQNANDEGGLRLFTAVKARRSFALGLWWRWHMWIVQRDSHNQVLALMLSFVLVRMAIILTDEFGFETISKVLSYGWLGFCIYTWFAPDLFRNWLKQELAHVKLDPNY